MPELSYPCALLRSRSKAKCDYVFKCTSGGYVVNSLFGLPGSTAERCADQAASECIADMEDRLSRETVQFTEAAIDVCADQVASKSCPGGNADEWSTQWHEFVSNVCGGVARGSVQSGGACERRTDCAGKHEHCLDGQCRMVTGPDLHQACTPQGVAGTLTESSECTTGWCVNTGYGGNCTVDCRDARGCIGDGFACLHLSTTGGPSSAFCLTPCSIDGHCNGMSCLPIDPMDMTSDTYCIDGEMNP